MKSAARVVVGLMSGTSADGVDAAVVKIQRRGAKRSVTPVSFQTFPYPRTLKRRILRLMHGEVAGAEEIASLDVGVGGCFAAAALSAIGRAGISLRRVDLIGSHGQTVCHRPRESEPATLQLGEPAVIAERTGITTVADFRPGDVAAGGEGAPLVPYAHFILFAHPKFTRAIHNLGGISNLTLLPAAVDAREITAFDTGPGNMVIDGLCRRLSRGRRAFDLNGAQAQRGRVDEDLLRSLLRHPYFSRRPPKSTGAEDFGAEFVARLLRRARRKRLGAADLLATATALTARSIGKAYRELVLPRIRKLNEIYFAGGGRRNRALMAMLKEELPFARVGVVEELGFDGDALEAQAFALLAYEAVEGVAANLPRVTGARHPVVLGKITPGKNYSRVILRR